MDQKRVEGDELLRGVANRMNKLSGKGEVATKHQCVAARVLNPRSSIDQHGRNNDGVQPRVFENPIAYGEPRVSESSKQNGSNDSEGNMQSQFGGSEPIGLSKSNSVVNPTSIGESWTVNPSRECVIEVEEGAGLAEGDGISVSRMAGSFVLKDPKLDVNNIDATTEAVANERSYTSLGESTIRSTMNPSCGSKSDVEEGIWSTKDPPHLVSEVNTQPGMSTNMSSIVHDANEFGYIRPTGWNLTNNNNVPTEHDDDAPITQSVDINSTPNSYAGAAVLEKVSVRLEHTLYGYFIGKRLAFPVFDSRGGLDAVLEGGSWMIRNSPIILKKWSVNTSLQKEEMTRIPIWVKLHDVPIQVFEEDGISLIASYLGKPIMLDSYTTTMCKESWGRSSFARCLIEINSEAEFTESITIGIPELEGPGFIKETIRVEYEWKPPRCHTCNIFGHLGDSCPKKVVNTPVVNNSTNTNTPNDGFQQVVNKRRDNKKNATVLSEVEDEDEDIENVYDESENLNLNHNPGASTPAHTVVNENNLSVCAILESHVDVAVVYDTCKKVCNRWKWTFNGSLCDKGSRIILGWNDDLVDVMIMAQINQECVQAMEVADVNSTGLHLTWNQKPKGSNGILKKIDRIMGFVNVDFGWNVHIEGYAMYRVVKWLKGLKSPFRKLLHNHDAHDLFIRVLNNSKADCMVRDVTDDEIKSVMFSMGDDRAPGPDGFTTAFFTKAWDVVGGDITCAIRDFFSNDKLLKELNHTIIPLIPKVTTPARINDYMPISCCNVLYKCISKIIANHVKEGLGDIVSINQSTFVPGHKIFDNILLTQELMRNYHRRRGPPRCAFKVDIQKAYDTVDWKFLETILVGFGFHPKMVQWIMVCVSGASYSISVNGNVHGWFKGKRGLRQGDPLSPYLFTLVMEILTLFLVSVIMDALEEFKQVSGLVPSIPKSTAYFCNVPNAIKASILNSMPFAEGVLPVKYLGVPLISSRLLYRDCKILVEKLESKASVFILPSRIVHDLEQLMRGFLWCQGEMNKGKAKVDWDSVYMPKQEGGLDVCPIKDLPSNMDITRLGFSLDDSVSNLISDGVWRWPIDWLSRIPVLAQLHVPLLLDDLDDVILWRDSDGVLGPFSVACVWDTIRTRADLVNWYKVWSKVRVLCGMDDISHHLMDVVAFIILFPKAKRWLVFSLGSLLLLLPTIFGWKGMLVTFKFKKMSTKSRLLLDQWKIPSYCIVHDRSTRQSHLDHSCSYRVAAGLRDVRLIICSHLGSCLV
ncbi:protein LAZ1 [Tanacetum coccineum]